MKVREGFVHVLWDHWHHSPDCLYSVPNSNCCDKDWQGNCAGLCNPMHNCRWDIYSRDRPSYSVPSSLSIGGEGWTLSSFLKLGFKHSLSLSPLYTLDRFTHWITLGLLSGWWGHYENSGYNQCSAPRQDLTSTISLAVGGLSQL